MSREYSVDYELTILKKCVKILNQNKWCLQYNDTFITMWFYWYWITTNCIVLFTFNSVISVDIPQKRFETFKETAKYLFSMNLRKFEN